MNTHLDAHLEVGMSWDRGTQLIQKWNSEDEENVGFYTLEKKCNLLSG